MKKNLISVGSLDAPFYTSIFSIANTNQAVEVSFLANNGEATTLIVYPKSLAYSQQVDAPFSLLFYGCFQPFIVNDETNTASVLNKDSQLNKMMRSLLFTVGSNKNIGFQEAVEGKCETCREEVNKPALKNPVALIGTGDQVYIDAGYGALKVPYSKHPISAWTHLCVNPQPTLTEALYADHLDKCYKYFYSFKVFNLYHKLLSINVWDDHEVRDGWGSHGDEYLDQTRINPALKPYYNLSKQAFVEHNMLGQIPDDYLKNNEALDQSYNINGVPIFAFDLRSNRNSCYNQLMSTSQFDRFKAWCNGLQADKEAIIISTVPVFYEQNKLVTNLTGRLLAKGELNDDIIDSWNSEQNAEQRDDFIRELVKLRERGVKPIIVSGDVHIGGMISCFYNSKSKNVKRRLCYEFIYSGLSHEKLGESRSAFKSGIQKRSEKVRIQDATYLVDSTRIDPVYEFTRSRLNFGALEFDNGECTASLFIVTDREGGVAKQKLKLNWTETRAEYNARAPKRSLKFYIYPWKWTAVPLPEVPYDFIPKESIDY